MEPFTDDPAQPARTDTSVLVAAVGSSVLALPGLVGGAGLVYLLLILLASLTDQIRGGDLVAVLLVVGAILLIPAGLLLAAGYWRVVRGGTPSARPALFWWLSAGYNGIGIVAAVASIIAGLLDQYPLVPVYYAAPALGWTVFMAWLSVTRARDASVVADPLAV